MKKTLVPYLLVVILLSLFAAQVIYAIHAQSPVHDDTNWLTIAWYLTHFWTWQGDYHVLMHPPLTFYLHGLPLRLLEWWRQGSISAPPEGALAAQFPYPYSAILRYDTAFTIAKLGLLPTAILAGWFVYLWAARLYGASAGVFALILYAFNPFWLSYTPYLNTDITIAALMFIATYTFWRACQEPSARRRGVAGLMLGLALLTRVSGVLLFPLFFLLAILFWYAHAPAQRPARQPLIVGWLAVAGLALLVLEAGYLFDCQPVRAFRPEQEADLLYRLLKTIPIPFGAYINNIRLHQSFLFWMTRSYFFAGQVRTEFLWYYNLFSFVLQNPVPLLIFLAASFGGWKLAAKRAWRAELFLVIPVIFLLLYFSLFFPVIGLRFALPAFPFLYVLASRIVTWKLLQRTSARVVVGALLVWYVSSSLAARPHYLAYCNELIGGMSQCAQWFDVESGEGLKALGRYVQQQQLTDLKLAYAGKGIPAYYGIRATLLKEPTACQPTDGIIAVSVSNFQYAPACYRWLEAYQPVHQIGYSLLIYSIPRR